jgi:hypothetical protein
MVERWRRAFLLLLCTEAFLDSLREGTSMKRSVMKIAVGALLFAGMMGSSVQAQLVTATWDGGNGDWEAAKWNGGQTAAAVFGDPRMSNGAFDVTIGGAPDVQRGRFVAP